MLSPEDVGHTLKDVAGREVSAGDRVVFVRPNYHDLQIGTVMRLTPKGFRVKYAGSGPEGLVRYEVVKIN